MRIQKPVQTLELTYLRRVLFPFAVLHSVRARGENMLTINVVIYLKTELFGLACNMRIKNIVKNRYTQSAAKSNDTY